MDKRERYGEAIKGLNQAIHHLTWLGEFWGFKGVVVLDWIRNYYTDELRGKRQEMLSARSSTYYAATGNACAHASQGFFLKLFWLVISFFCSQRALHFSDCFAKIGLKNMNVGELDVRATILRKASVFRRAERRAEALECINEALNRDEVAPHSRVFLMIGRADILAASENAADKGSAYIIYDQALDLKDKIDVATKVRLYKSYAQFLIKYKPGLIIKAREMIFEAKELAIENGLDDQMEKIIVIEKQI